MARADPAHVDDSRTLTLQLDDDEYALDTDGATAGAQLAGTLDGGTTLFAAEVTPPPFGQAPPQPPTLW